MRFRSIQIINFVFFFLIIVSTVISVPVIDDTYPENNSKIDNNPLLKINVSNDKVMHIKWFFNYSGKWIQIGVNESVGSGVYKQIIPNGTKEGKNYQWRVNISDGYSYTNETFWFGRMGWQTISWRSSSFGGHVDVTGKIFPPPEGNGIIYQNETIIKSYKSDNVIFSLNFITTPKIGRIFDLGEYLIEGETIGAVIFKVSENFQNSGNIVKIDFLSSNNDILLEQNLDLNNTITTLGTPLFINKSGLWNIRLYFIPNNGDKNFLIWEKLPEEYIDDDKNCMTFNLSTSHGLYFENYYERILPVFTLSEVLNFQQMSLLKQQGQYLNDTAKSISDISQGQLSIQIISIIGVGLFSLIVALLSIYIKDNFIMERKILKGLYGETTFNKSQFEASIESINFVGKTNIEIFPTKRDAYFSALYSGTLLSVSKELQNMIHNFYHTLENFDYYSGGMGVERFQEKLISDADKILDKLKDEMKFFNFKE